MKKLLANIINTLTLAIHFIVQLFVDEEVLLKYKPIHLCWWFEKHGLSIPKYFIGAPGSPTFLEPGGDADFGIGFWGGSSGTAPTIVSDIVHGGHIKSLKSSTSATSYVYTPDVLTSTFGVSVYVYFNALPSSSVTVFTGLKQSANGSDVLQLQITSGGVLQALNGAGTQLGSNGATLSTGQWYRISMFGSITSTTVNSVTVAVDSTSSISIVNQTYTNITPSCTWIGNVVSSNTCDIRFSDILCYSGTSYSDGNYWVTAKRPVANGTANQFSTQIGSGGSGYGTGHSPQVNERPLSTTNGWSMVGAGSVASENYNIETKSAGDIDISAATINAVEGWASISSLVGETLSMLINGSTYAKTTTSTPTVYMQQTGTIYPSGTVGDIGIQTTTALTTVSLYECGVLVAYIPLNPLSISVSDTTTATDSVVASTTASLLINVSDTTAITEFIGYVPDVVVMIENVQMSIVGGGVSTLTLSISDTTVITDSVVIKTSALLFNVSDASVVTDSTTENVSSPQISISDTTSITDIVITQTSNPQINVSDTTQVTDSVSLYETSYKINVLDTTSIADSVLINISTPQINTSDTTIITDTFSLYETYYNIPVSDTTIITDSTVMGGTEYIIISDTTSITDTVSILIPILRISSSDTSLITDSATMSSIEYLNVSDTTIVTESTAEVVSSISAESFSASDTTSILDSISITVSAPQINVSDTVIITDSIVLYETFYKISISDTSTVADTVSILLISPGAINVSDTSTLSDSATIYITKLIISVSDVTIVIDSSTLQLGALPNINISVSDTVVVTDSVLISNSYMYVSTTDTTLVTDTNVEAFTSYISVSNTTVLTDSNTIQESASSYTVSTSDISTVSDISTIYITTLKIKVSDTSNISDTTSLASFQPYRYISVSDTTTLSEYVKVGVIVPIIGTYQIVYLGWHLNSYAVIADIENTLILNAVLNRKFIIEK